MTDHDIWLLRELIAQWWDTHTEQAAKLLVLTLERVMFEEG